MTSPPVPQTSSGLGPSRLESLLESARLLNSTLDLDALLGHLLRTVMGRYLIGRGVVAIRNGEISTVQVSRGVAALKKDAAFTIEAAHAAGLLVGTWTFRPENQFLAADFRDGGAPGARNESGSVAEIRRYLATGLDAFFTDDPALGLAARDRG